MNKRNAGPVLLPLLFLCSSAVSTVLFAVVTGTRSAACIIPGILIPLPETVCAFIFYCRLSDALSGTPEADAVQTAARSGPPQPEAAVIQELCECTGEDTDAGTVSAAGSAADSIEACRAISVRMRLFAPVLEELNVSLSRSLSSTTEPISAELLRIRQTNAAFLESIGSYEDEVRNKTVVRKLENESTVFDRDLEGMYAAVSSMFSALEKYIGDLRSISGQIGGTAGSIGELSEQIRVLSFNASIEAARAGQAGAGFRVIAAEIKRLSAGTDDRLREIERTLGDTNRIFSELKTELDSSREHILTVVSERRSGFGMFRDTLETYYPRLEQLYTGVTAIIDSLTKSMNVISPVVQLHEITSQEIGNMGQVVTDLCRWTGASAQSVCGERPPEPGKDDARAAAADIRKRLTTEKELEALGRGIRKTVPSADIELGINNRSIELF